MAGFIKLYRDLQENIIWKEKRKFSKAEAFIDLMFKCNHRCDRILLGNEKILIKRGQFLSSNYKLSECWNWSESSVREYIKFLIKEGMAVAYPTKKNTIYEVSNYCVYQSIDTEALQEKQNAQKTHRKRTENAQKTPNNNDNNIKELKEVINTYTQDAKLKESLESFLEMRINKKSIPTVNAMNLIFKTLNPFDIETQIQMIEKSIISNWTGVFPLSGDKKSSKDWK